MVQEVNKKVCVVGLGYIGLPTGALLANKGYHIIGVDVNQKTVDTINRGEIHIVENDLDTFVHSAVGSGHLKAYTEPAAADIFMICVPTPFHEGGAIPEPNLDYVVSASKAIAPYVVPGNCVILESTSPVGTTELIRDTLKENGVNTDEIYIAYCPERVLPGRIMIELIENDRIVGGINSESAARVSAFYKTFVQGEVLVTDSKTAEMSKLVENSFRDVNIAFANELSMICENEGINVWELIRLANHHPRVNILQPGAGVGGHCIAVDPWFIVARNPDNSKVIKTAREVNNYKTLWAIEKIKNAALTFQNSAGRAPKIAALGLAFKPNIDDLRESPALFIAHSLKEQGHDVVAIEPNIEEHSEFELFDYEEALNECDILVYLVAHKEFKEKREPAKVQIDFCGILT